MLTILTQLLDFIFWMQYMYNTLSVNFLIFRIPANFRKVVYCTVIEHGGDDEWHFIWNLYKQSTTNKEKEIILSALGCTRNTKLLNKYDISQRSYTTSYLKLYWV